MSNGEEYFNLRRAEVASRLEPMLANSAVARQWYAGFKPASLYSEAGEYDGHVASKDAADAALSAAGSAQSMVDIVRHTEDFILHFCGFSATSPPTKYLTNGVHFQFEMSTADLLGTDLPMPSQCDDTPDHVKSLFDDVNVCSAELLLRSVTVDDVANPFSPGQPMGKLLKLPLFAQCMLVLINAVEATWFQSALPDCPLAINLYASLMEPDAPLLELVRGASVVEVMELTKGCKRNESVVLAANALREAGYVLLLDDFDAAHPARNANATGVKVSVFTNAFHALQTFRGLDSAGEQILPFKQAPPCLDKPKPQAFDILDYYGQLVPKLQPNSRVLVMEGSENCLKSEVSPGPPLNFGEPLATLASAHVYKAVALTLSSMAGEGYTARLVHQGGRALYAHEVFDSAAQQVITALNKSMPAARAGDAGTMSWIGTEAVRRAALQTRKLVCAIQDSGAS